jgi:hypothetical protein
MGKDCVWVRLPMYVADCNLAEERKMMMKRK